MSILRGIATGILWAGVIGGAIGATVYSQFHPLKPIVSGDFDRDGKKDALCRRGSSNQLQIIYDVELEEIDENAYVNGYEIKISGKDSSPIKGRVRDAEYLNGWGDEVFVGDVNKDGILDITLHNEEGLTRSAKKVSDVVFLGDGNGIFRHSTKYSDWTIESREPWDHFSSDDYPVEPRWRLK